MGMLLVLREKDFSSPHTLPVTVVVVRTSEVPDELFVFLFNP